MGRSDQWPSFTAAVLIMAIAHPTSSCSGLTRASPTSHPSLVFHDISVLCATTDARVKPEHDAERVTTCQNENCCLHGGHVDRNIAAMHHTCRLRSDPLATRRFRAHPCAGRGPRGLPKGRTVVVRTVCLERIASWPVTK